MSAPARAEVLARIRAAIADSPAPTITRDYRMTMSADVELFVDRLEDYRATVHRCTEADLPATITAALDAAGATRVVTPIGLDPDWVAPSRTPGGRIVFADSSSVVAADLDGDDVAVVTSCTAAIADTGTLVLDCSDGQGRRLLTLVPDHHVCVVTVDRIVGSVPDAFRLLDPRRPLTWISGPSATSDIELRRVEGVHGPRHLVVIVVEPAAQHSSSPHGGTSS